ncbi:PREDICTED: kelch domain-containing protein 1-like [Priapulus caudatus]|uniref:Kelch domain-containing protein 1-like n=1 Tax=Priapulus caudatus TaxID=37621 RepID=A0ABM1E9K9_PRICU|nr:PREDICTED: kelch domain-containing protein 1-like [Priapulus caudatus]
MPILSSELSTITAVIPNVAPIANNINVTWIQNESSQKLRGRHSHASTTVCEKLYTFGGVVKEGDYDEQESAELHVFEKGSGKWEIVAVDGTSKPPPRTACAIAAVGKKLYVFGGMNHFKGWLNDLHVFDIETSEWKQIIAGGERPSARDKVTAATIGNKIYFFGGFGPKRSVLPSSSLGSANNGDDDDGFEDVDNEEDESEGPMAEFGWFNDLVTFDTEKSQWEAVHCSNDGMPTPRAGHSMCAIANLLVIFGGRDPLARRNDIHILDTDTMSWVVPVHPMGRLPAPRSFHTGTAVGRRMVVLGGRSTDNQHYNDLHIFDIDTRQWLQPTVSGTVPVPRGMHTATACGEYLVVFGGASDLDHESQQCMTYHSETFLINTGDLLKGGAITKT